MLGGCKGYRANISVAIALLLVQYPDIVSQQPYSSKAQSAVYFPEDSWPADQSCKLSHTLGVKNSYTPCGQPYTTLSEPYNPCGQPYTPCGQPYTSLLWYKPVIPLPLRGLADTLLGLRPRSVYPLTSLWSWYNLYLHCG